MTPEEHAARIDAWGRAEHLEFSERARRGRAEGRVDQFAEAIAVLTAPSLAERRAVLVERVRYAVHDAPATERGEVLALGRQTLLLTALTAAASPECEATAVALIDQTVAAIDAAVARGDLETWARHHAGEVTHDEMVLRLLASGRTRMAPDPLARDAPRG